jgi:hypothetical protein
LAACDHGTEATASVAVVRAKLPDARPVRYVKLEELSEWNGNAWASVAEFNVIDATGATVDRKLWSAKADSVAEHDVATNAIDGHPETLWHTQWEGTPPPPPHALTVDMGAPVKVAGFRYLPRQDKSVNGTIAKYRFYVSTDGVNWGSPVSEGDFSNMSAPPIEKTVIFAEQVENHPPVLQSPDEQSSTMGESVAQQVHATDADDDAIAYTAKGLPPGLTIGPANGLIIGTPIVPGTYKVTVSVTDNKSASVSSGFVWKVNAPPAVSAPPKPGDVRFVKLEELTEIGGNPWGSIAELNVLDANGANLPRDAWTASADSSDTSDRPSNAIDGNPQSFWHSQWNGAAPPPPHSFIVDLGRAATVRGFRYLPRQDQVMNGRIAKFRFFTSIDGVNWGLPLAEGDFSTMGAPNAEKTVMLK